MRKNLPLIPLLVSVALGLATYFFVFDFLNNIQKRQTIALEQKMQVIKLPEYKILFAKIPIKEYDEFNANNVEIITLKGEVAPKNIFADMKELEGKFALKDIDVGNVIQKSDVVGTARPKTIQDLVPVGMRAVSVKVKDTVLDFIQPGDKVDLMAEFNDDTGEKYSKIILQKVLVLAKGNRIEGAFVSKDDKNAAVNSDMLTIALNIKQAEAISALASRTALKVAWRSNDDEKVIETQGTTANFLVGEKKAPAEQFRNRFIY